MGVAASRIMQARLAFLDESLSPFGTYDRHDSPHGQERESDHEPYLTFRSPTGQVREHDATLRS